MEELLPFQDVFEVPGDDGMDLLRKLCLPL